MQKKTPAGNHPDKQNPTSSPAFHLAGDEVHIWCAALERPSPVVTRLSVLLSPDEKARAERFYFERDRVRYIVGRGLLRTILGKYLGMDPAHIEFSYGPYGKPALKTDQPNQTLQFNLAHSQNQALFAFCADRPLGIDLEHVREMPDEDALARHVFSPAEAALVASLSGQQKHAAFFKIWTCKEAVLKASGHGLTKPLDQTEISLTGETARLAVIDGDPDKAARWRLELFKPLPDYQAALAFEGRTCQIIFRQIDEDLADISEK
jgi:4'-phosphopantetheinyl transferase